MKAIEPLGIGWVIQLTIDWGPYTKGQEFKVVSIEKPNVFNECNLICSGCIRCEGWEKSICMTDDSKTIDYIPTRIFTVISRTGIETYREGRDLINIVGMI